MPFRNTPRIGTLACFEMKMIGKPYVGELQVRFDEGGTGLCFTEDSTRARSRKRRIQPRVDLTNAEPVLYSTQFSPESVPGTSTMQRSSARLRKADETAAGGAPNVSATSPTDGGIDLSRNEA
jgi:hypothetical protein